MCWGLFLFTCARVLTLVRWSSQKATLTNDTKDKEYTPHDLPQRQSVQPQETCSIARRAKRMRSEVSRSCRCFAIISFCQVQLSDLQSVSWPWLPRCLEVTFFFFCVRLSMTACLQQRGFFKTEPGDICKNRHNLRRRMGVCSTKPEPGKNK